MILVHLIFVILSISSFAQGQTLPYEPYITFYAWNSEVPTQRFVSTFNSTIAQQGCDPNGNFSFVIHGWLESVNTEWVGITVSNLLTHRGGCVFFMDYSIFSVLDYGSLVGYWAGIYYVLVKKLQQIGNYDRQYVFGFSYGARLAQYAGIGIGKQQIARMDLCEPAGPYFNMYDDPKPAAKNVACINTSYDKGTYIYNCHQNFRMGYCGYSQAAAGPFPKGNHGLCPYFYNSAFTNNFTENNYYGCTSARALTKLPSNVKMGYTANFNRTLYQGDIFIVTAAKSPYV